MVDVSLIFSSFAAGLFTFLAPCTLPLVPGYLAFISGVPLNSLKDSVNPNVARRKIFLNGLFFVIGFSLVFIILGTLIGFVGAAVLAPYRIWLSRFGGVFIIFFGFFMLDVFKIPQLARPRRIKLPVAFHAGRPVTALAFGSIFGLGWTPCAGPILGSILLLAAFSATALEGALLLAIYSAGLMLPFLLAAVVTEKAVTYIEKMYPIMNTLSVIGGLFLIFLGTLIATDSFYLLFAWELRLFQFVDYKNILNFFLISYKHEEVRQSI